MTDISQIIKAAKDLGIKITAAELGTDRCQCWVDRVALAKKHWDAGDMASCQEMIDSANAYAV